MRHKIPEPLVWETARAEVEVPMGRISVSAEFFGGHLDEAYDWLRVGIEKATEAVLAQLGESFDKR